MTIKNILKNKPPGFISVAPDTSVADVLAVLADKRIGAVLVTEGDRLAGILSERDVVRCLATHGISTMDMAASELMTANPTCGTLATSVPQAMAIMTDGHFRHLPILEDGKLIGLVSIGDVVKAMIEQSQFEVDTLRTYVSGAV